MIEKNVVQHKVIYKFFQYMVLATQYIFGILFFVLGAGMLFTQGFVKAYPLLLAGVLLIPSIWNYLTKDTDFSGSRWVQILTVIAVISYAMSTYEV